MGVRPRSSCLIERTFTSRIAEDEEDIRRDVVSGRLPSVSAARSPSITIVGGYGECRHQHVHLRYATLRQLVGGS